MGEILIWAVTIAVIVVGLWVVNRRGGRPVPEAIRAGNDLPDFEAERENGDRVHSSDLEGRPVVVLFVRGNWCPFCSSQVADLTSHYKEINELGGRLVFITPKPLETTRRVAEFYEVDFEFWLDGDLKIARQLGLLQEQGVPEEYRSEYGDATVWPAALVLDAHRRIRFAEMSKAIKDRPDSSRLLAELRKIMNS